MAAKLKLIFVTYQAWVGSTVQGRIKPLLPYLTSHYDVELHVLKSHSSSSPLQIPGVRLTTIGTEPFKRIAKGKVRDRGLILIWRMLSTALRSAYALLMHRPDIVVIVKPLPAPVLAVWLWRLFHRSERVILDVDDFELMANHLTSLAQRAAIHWSERSGARLASMIAAATPFLVDHFTQLTGQKRPVVLVPTSYDIGHNLKALTPNGQSQTLLYIGSISISSGHRVDLLPEILKTVQQTHPQTKLLMAGSGDDVMALQAAFTQAGLQDSVTWTGRFKTDAVGQLLKQATIIIDPIDDSLANRAKSSFRVTLAAHVGWPIVTSNIGIRPYFLPDTLHPKFFAEPGAPAQYAQKIVDLLDQPLTTTERQSMQHHAETYSAAKLAAQWQDILHPS